MPVMIKLSASLRKAVPQYDPGAGLEMDPAGGLTVAQILENVGLDPAEVKIIMVNGAAGELNTNLADGDRVGLFPAVGGG